MSDVLALKKFAGDSLYNIIRQGVVLALGVVTSIILTRGLGPDGRGIYALALLLPTLVITFTDMGVDSATIYFMARRDYDERTIIGTNILLSLVLGVLSMVVGYALIKVAGNLLFKGVPFSILLIAVVLLPLKMIRTNLMSVLLGIQDFKAYNAALLLPEFARLLLVTVMLLLLKLGVMGALFSGIGAELVGSLALLVLYQIRLRRNGQHLGLTWNGDYAKASLHFGLRTYLGGVIGFLNYRSDKFLVNMFDNTAAVGAYDVSVNMAERLWLLSNAVSSVLYPKVASLKDAEEERIKITLLVGRNILWITLVFSLILWPLADFIMVLLYGKEFLSSGMGLKLLLPGIITLGFARILANDIAGRGRPELNSIHSIIAFAINVVLNIILIPKLGFFGASISSSVSYTANAVMKVIAYRQMTGVTIKSILVPTREDGRLFLKLFNLIVFQIKAKFA